MEKRKINIFLYGAVLSVNLLGFCIGNGYSWTSPVLSKLSSTDIMINPLSKPTTILEESWLTSIVNLGAIVGCLMAIPLSEKIGRKKTLMVFCTTIFISYSMFAFGKYVYFFLLGRLILGIGLGCVFSTLPTYVGEISENHNRGMLGSIMGIMMVSGVLFNYAIGPYVSVSVLSFLNIVPAVLFYIIFGLCVPESPYYYVSKNNLLEAEHSLKKFRNVSDDAIKKELLYITDFIKQTQNNKSSLSDFIHSKSLRKGLVISCGLMLAQQFTGTTALLAYMQYIFDASGSTIPSHISVIITGAFQVIANVFTIYFIDRLGRRNLIFISLSGCCLSLTSLGVYFVLMNNNFNIENIYWLPVLSFMTYISFYSFGLGSIPWTIMGELFSSHVKSVASSIATCVCLAAAFIITMCFQYLILVLGMAGSFFLFAVACGIFLVFTKLLVPETKGKSFLEIQHLLST